MNWSLLKANLYEFRVALVYAFDHAPRGSEAEAIAERLWDRFDVLFPEVRNKYYEEWRNLYVNEEIRVSEQKPTVGRIIFYQAHGSPNGQHKSEPRPAIITRVHDDGECDITVFNPSGLFFNKAKLGGPDQPGSWYWPPRNP